MKLWHHPCYGGCAWETDRPTKRTTVDLTRTLTCCIEKTTGGVLVKSSLAPEQNFVLSSKCHLPVAFPQAFSLASMLYCTACNLPHLIAADICQMRTATDAEDSVRNPLDLFRCYASACGVNMATNLQAFHAEYHLSHPDWLKLPECLIGWNCLSDWQSRTLCSLNALS